MNKQIIFDGREFADNIAKKLKDEVIKLPRRLKLAIWVEETNLAGKKYVQKKMEMAAWLGVEVVLNRVDSDEDGVVVQLPHTNSKFLIDQIDLKKDVDGLREDSPFRPAVVRAVLTILADARKWTMDNGQWTVMVVGVKGFVGQKLLESLSTVNFPLSIIGMDKDDFNPEKLKDADVIISCTGQAGLIKPGMVKNGVVAIDVGYPKGDFDPQVAAKASFFTPVPGGVGPVTVVMLFANLLKSIDE